MLRLARFLVISLMAVAIPVQAIAVTTVMHFCPPSHAASVDPALRQADAQSMHTHPESASADGTMAVDASNVRLDPASHHADHSGHGIVKCHSAGFSIAAFTGPTLVARAQARSLAPARPDALSYKGVILDGLDRPPKQPLS